MNHFTSAPSTEGIYCYTPPATTGKRDTVYIAIDANRLRELEARVAASLARVRQTRIPRVFGQLALARLIANTFRRFAVAVPVADGQTLDAALNEQPGLREFVRQIDAVDYDHDLCQCPLFGLVEEVLMLDSWSRPDGRT